MFSLLMAFVFCVRCWNVCEFAFSFFSFSYFGEFCSIPFLVLSSGKSFVSICNAENFVASDFFFFLSLASLSLFRSALFRILKVYFSTLFKKMCRSLNGSIISILLLITEWNSTCTQNDSNYGTEADTTMTQNAVLHASANTPSHQPPGRFFNKIIKNFAIKWIGPKYMGKKTENKVDVKFHA